MIPLINPALWQESLTAFTPANHLKKLHSINHHRIGISISNSRFFCEIETEGFKAIIDRDINLKLRIERGEAMLSA